MGELINDERVGELTAGTSPMSSHTSYSSSNGSGTKVVFAGLLRILTADDKLILFRVDRRSPRVPAKSALMGIANRDGDWLECALDDMHESVYVFLIPASVWISIKVL